MPADPNRVRDLFLTAVELPTDQRPGYLAETCGEDAELRAEVDRLLTENADSDSLLGPGSPSPTDATGEFIPSDPGTVEFERGSSSTEASDRGGPYHSEIATEVDRPDGETEMSAPADTYATRVPEPGESRLNEAIADLDEGIGTVIAGRYRLVKVIGEGGMGSVYLASQSEPVRRQVALKLIKTGMDSRAVLARFDAERQALALMDHPNIARIYDGGVTPAGQPFFVMELVEGVQLTQYCDQKRLSVQARLELFVAVCQAVQHAHQKGIIHRDLKPGNVLVTEVDGRPTPKVIDFGVAKATEQNLTDMSFSDTGAIVGTPSYMSPEQADPSSMDIDTRTDVYALGVILYELLVGSPPLDARRLQRGALLEMLRMVREVDPPRPSTRLSTAEALPNIAANRSIEPARLSRLLRGELDWVVMKALEKDRTRRYDTANGFARDIQRYLADEVVDARPPSTSYRLAKFVRRHRVQVLAACFVLVALIAGITGTTLGLLEARRQARIANEETEKKAKALQAEAFQRGEAEKRLAQRDKANEILLGVFNDLDPRRSNDKDQPVAALLGKRLKSAATQLEGEATTDLASVAKMQVALGKSQFNLGNYGEAAILFQKALNYYREKSGPDDEKTIATADNLATAYNGAGKLELALPLWEETLARSRVKLGADDDTTLTCMTNLTVGYFSVARLDRALVMGEEAHERLKKKHGADYKEALGVANALVLIYRGLGKLDQAISLGEETLAYRMVTLGPNDPGVFTSMNNLALCYQQKGDIAKAVSLFEESLVATRNTLGPDHPDTLNGLANLADAYRAAGNYEKALSLTREVFERMKVIHGEDHPETLFAMGNLGRMYVFAGRPAEAVPIHERALALKRVKLGNDHESTLHGMVNLGNAYADIGEKERALALYQEAYAINLKKYGADHPTTLVSMGNIAQTLLELGRAEQGFAMLEETIKVSIASKGPDHPDTLSSLNNLGEARLVYGSPDLAVLLLEQAYTGRRKRLGLDHPHTLRSMGGYAIALERSGKPDQALPLSRELAVIWKGRAGESSRDYRGATVNLIHNLVIARHWSEAEAMIRPLLPALEKAKPEDWVAFQVDSMLGASLLGQKKFADAAPLLEAGYEGMVKNLAKIPPHHRRKLVEAVEWLIDLADATEKADDARRWREEKAKLPPKDVTPSPPEKK